MTKRSALYEWKIPRMARMIAITCLLLSLGEAAVSQTADQTNAVLRAPKGWNSWNSFANIVNSEIVQQQAKAMATDGMKETGYEYVVIDESWWLGDRDLTTGKIIVNPKQWPSLPTKVISTIG